MALSRFNLTHMQNISKGNNTFHNKFHGLYCSVAYVNCRDVNNYFKINETCNGCVDDSQEN